MRVTDNSSLHTIHVSDRIQERILGCKNLDDAMYNVVAKICSDISHSKLDEVKREKLFDLVVIPLMDLIPQYRSIASSWENAFSNYDREYEEKVSTIKDPKILKHYYKETLAKEVELDKQVLHTTRYFLSVYRNAVDDVESMIKKDEIDESLVMPIYDLFTKYCGTLRIGLRDEVKDIDTDDVAKRELYFDMIGEDIRYFMDMLSSIHTLANKHMKRTDKKRLSVNRQHDRLSSYNMAIMLPKQLKMMNLLEHDRATNREVERYFREVQEFYDKLAQAEKLMENNFINLSKYNPYRNVAKVYKEESKLGDAELYVDTKVPRYEGEDDFIDHNIFYGYNDDDER